MRGVGFLFMIALSALVLAATPAAAASPSSTTASGCSNRSDVAVLDEYCPTPPGADGRGVNRGPTLKSVLPRAAARRLAKAGRLGQALLQLPTAAPVDVVTRRHSRGRGLDADELLTQGRLGKRHASRGNPIKTSATAMTDGSVGAVFGLVLLVSSLGLAGAAWLRFRRRQLS
jgi:hypothetical protein